MDKLTIQEKAAAVMVYDEVVVNRNPMPSYSQLADVAACSGSGARNILFSLVGKGVLASNAGRKPVKFTDEGEREVAALFLGVQAGEVDVTPPPEVKVGPPPAEPPAPPIRRSPSLLDAMSQRLSMKPDALLAIIKNQIISVNRKYDQSPITNEECALVLHTMHKYGLDPMVRQVYAFRSKGRLQIVVGYDGWIKIVQSRREHLGFQITAVGPDIKVPGNKYGMMIPMWMEGKIESEGRIPTSFRIYFLEWFDPNNDIWVAKPYHRYRMKLFIQHAREHYGISLMDDIDAEYVMRAPETRLAQRLEDSLPARKESITKRLQGEQHMDVTQAEDAEYTEADADGDAVVADPDADAAAPSGKGEDEAPPPVEQEGEGESGQSGDEAESPPLLRSSPSLFDDEDDPGPAPPPEREFKRAGHDPQAALREAIAKRAEDLKQGRQP